MKALILDFDGVIVDSQYECLLVGFNSYLTFNKNTKLFSGKKITFNNFEKIKIRYNHLVEKYKKLRPYVIDAFCWYVMMSILDKGIKICNQDEYNNFRAKLINGSYDSYIREYYLERSSLQNENFNKWINLCHPFKKVIGSIKKLEEKFIIAIATNNRKEAIKPLLDNFGIKPVITTDSLVSRDKKIQIGYIKSKLSIGYESIYFIDDQVQHFKKLKSYGINCYLALWGYNNDAQQNEAKNMDISLLKESDFYNTFK